jgi:hypothetical protein
MQSIGARLTSVASLPDQELAALVATTTTETRRREFQHAEEAASSPECPGYWRAALGRYRAEFLAHVDTPGFSLPSEFHGLGSMAAGYRALRAALHGFGVLLADWPALWEAAGDLNAQRQGR